MQEICLVDTSWLLNRSLYAFKDFYDTKGNPIGALFGTTNFIKTVIKRQLPTVFCLDSKSEFRRQLNEEYKANRESKNVWQLHDKLKDLTRGLRIAHFAEADGYEADDVLFSLAFELSQKGWKVYVYSSDNDMLQTLQFPNVFVTRHITQNEIDLIDENSDYYVKNYPVSPDRLAVYRAFRGDSSDNLSSVVPRMQDKLIVTLTNLIYERVNDKTNKDEIIKLVNSYTWTETQRKWIDKFIDNVDKFITNYKIMKLVPVKTNIYYMAGYLDDTINLAEEMELYQYSSFLRNLRGGMKNL